MDIQQTLTQRTSIQQILERMGINAQDHPEFYIILASYLREGGSNVDPVFHVSNTSLASSSSSTVSGEHVNDSDNVSVAGETIEID